ncbi:Signal transduction histidine kinase [Actinacidiphila alni]|uniref:histidine kinase n=1 Tax=Actinacidiphila alni TaxID=380248 RepID=A0A1I2K2Y6_9ACTN|nr:sensor histidine kinase [Actinacidiphila alni]SFF60729.1 Signal transduction histidine kinase [Actinacidiphila alni]
MTSVQASPATAAGDALGTVRAVAARIRERVRRRLPAVAVDALFAAALFAGVCVLSHEVLRARPVSFLLVQTGLTLPLVWRRRAPLPVFCCVAAAAFGQWLADLQTPTDVALLVALYTVAAACDRRRLMVAFAILEAGIVLATVAWAEHHRGVATFASLSAMAVTAAVFGGNTRSRRDHLAFLEDRAVRLERERDQRAQLAVADERARIAREMHDIVTHNLSVMVALADGAVFAQGRSPDRAETAMRQVSATGRQAITDMRRFLGVLRADEPDALRHPMPGISQLESLADQVRAAGLPTVLTVTGDPGPVPAAAQLTVYRLVQEALTNTLKHAPAGTRAEVRIGCAPDTLTVTVTDDGPVPAAAATGRPGADGAARSPGHGIPGMRERAAAYGGSLTAGPVPGGGWRVTAVLVLGAPPEAL